MCTQDLHNKKGKKLAAVDAKQNRKTEVKHCNSKFKCKYIVFTGILILSSARI